MTKSSRHPILKDILPELLSELSRRIVVFIIETSNVRFLLARRWAKRARRGSDLPADRYDADRSATASSQTTGWRGLIRRIAAAKNQLKSLRLAASRGALPSAPLPGGIMPCG